MWFSETQRHQNLEFETNSSSRGWRQHLCVWPHNEEISTSHSSVTIWTDLPEATAERSWAENSLILLAAPMNGPYSVPLKTDINQQSSAKRQILQLSQAWVRHQSHLVMHISTHMLYTTQHKHCMRVCVCVCGRIRLPSVNINSQCLNTRLSVSSTVWESMPCHHWEIICFSRSPADNNTYKTLRLFVIWVHSFSSRGAPPSSVYLSQRALL